MASLTDRYDNIRRTSYGDANAAAFARSPLNRNAYGGEAGYQYRRQEEAYGRALRQLRRASRRGDTGAALQEIAVRDQAMQQGFTPGGIRDRAEFNADREAWQAQMGSDANDARLFGQLARKRAAEEMAEDPNADPAVQGGVEPPMTQEGTPGVGADGVPDMLRRPAVAPAVGAATVNPAATAGAGRGRRLGRRAFGQPEDDPDGAPGSMRRTFRPRYF